MKGVHASRREGLRALEWARRSLNLDKKIPSAALDQIVKFHSKLSRKVSRASPKNEGPCEDVGRSILARIAIVPYPPRETRVALSRRFVPRYAHDGWRLSSLTRKRVG